ncbi:MAG: energy-coupling factor transporter ATPase [Bifidobacteriaceae bacterium]|nr:energy-coupling factor transporter ATPase [Bifidobacteriaceae bacterium]
MQTSAAPRDVLQPGGRPVAELRDVTFRYGGITVLDSVSVTIHDGEWVALVGANGSGKTTLARLLSGLLSPDAGTVRLMGRLCFATDSGADTQAYREARRSIGLVQQNPEDQIVTSVVEDDVAFGPENLGLPPHSITGRVREALSRTGMERHALADPDALSGGQQQRVAIAGALAMEPALLVLDEPTAMLDPAGRAGTLRTMQAAHDAGTTIVHVTHIPSEMRRATRVIKLEGGKLVYDGPAEGCALCAVDAGRASGASDTSGTSNGTKSTSSARSGSGNSSSGNRGSINSNAASDESAFSVRDVTFRYRNASEPALHGVNLTVRRGEFLTITGANGSGKSTLLSLLCGIEAPTSGEVRSLGEHPHSRKGRKRLLGRVGYVMQMPERQLFADTVAQDVAFGPHNLGLQSSELDERVHDTLEMVGITALADRSPWELSGGQQRLAAIAGVLSMRPEAMLLDEPTAGLDARASRHVIGLLDALHRQGVTIVVVTHDPQRFRSVATRTFCLDGDAHGGTAANATADALSNATYHTSSNTDDIATGTSNDHSPSSHAEGSASSKCSSQVSSDHQRTSHSDHQRTRHRLVSRMDTRVLIILCLVMMAGMFTVSTPLQLAWAFAGILVGMWCTDAGPRRVLSSCTGLIALIVVLGLFNVFFVRTGTPVCHIGSLPITDEGLRDAVLYSLRFALVIVIGATAVLAASTTRLTDAAESLLSPLARCGVPIHECALIMTLALRFLPIISREFTQLAHAQASRGGSIATGRPAQRVRSAVSLLVPVFAMALRHAEHVGTAMESRGYESGIARTHWHQNRPGAADALACIGVALWLAGLIVIAHLA